MGISSKSISSSYKIRSISFPCRSHPNIIKVEEGLKRLETWDVSFMRVDHNGSLSRLRELYEGVEELLNLPMTQRAFSHYQNRVYVDQLLEGSVRVLDICGITRDMVSQIKEQVRDLQCSLRRRRRESSIESSISRFTSFTKKIQKDAKKAIANLKQVDDVIICASMVANLDHHLVSVVRVLMEVSEMTILVSKSILSLFSLMSKPSKWSIVSKMIMHKGRVGCEEQQGNVNGLEDVGVALLNLCINKSSNEGEKIQIAQTRMEAMEASIESIENGLDCLFRHLVRTRTLLLNLMSL